MPIYEYQCSACQHQFDLMQKIHEEPAKNCPHCHQNTAVRLVSAAGFQLKGTGWYATDFKHKGTSEKKTANESSTEGGSSKPKNKGDQD